MGDVIGLQWCCFDCYIWGDFFVDIYVYGVVGFVWEVVVCDLDVVLGGNCDCYCGGNRICQLFYDMDVGYMVLFGKGFCVWMYKWYIICVFVFGC